MKLSDHNPTAATGWPIRSDNRANKSPGSDRPLRPGFVLEIQVDDAKGTVRCLPTAALNVAEKPAQRLCLQRSDLEDRADKLGFQFLGLSIEDGAAFDDRTIVNLVAESTRTDDSCAVLIVQALVAHIVCRYGQMTKHAKVGGLAPWQQRRAEALLAADLASPQALAVVAKKVRLSVSHFSRAFHVSTGQSPHQWLTQRRLERAAGMLQGGTESLAQIASLCGFCDQSHFTRVFSRERGVAPGYWRRQFEFSGANQQQQLDGRTGDRVNEALLG